LFRVAKVIIIAAEDSFLLDLFHVLPVILIQPFLALAALIDNQPIAKMEALIGLEALIQGSGPGDEVSPSKRIHGKQSVLTRMPVRRMIFGGRMVKDRQSNVFPCDLSQQGDPGGPLPPHLFCSLLAVSINVIGPSSLFLKR